MSANYYRKQALVREVKIVEFPPLPPKRKRDLRKLCRYLLPSCRPPTFIICAIPSFVEVTMEGICGTQDTDPLQNPIILECIFKHLDDINDLKHCREVCRAWRDSSRKAMRASAEVEIRCDESNPRGISKFLELVESEESTFFQGQGKPLVDHFILMRGEGHHPAFWKAMGTHIKSLELYLVEFQSADSFRHAIFKSCPNLEHLKIGHVKVHGERVPEPTKWVPPKHSQNSNLRSLEIVCMEGEFSVTFLEIFSNYPGLKKLKVSEFEDADQLEEAFGALGIARQHDATSWNLKDVELRGGSEDMPVPPSFIRIFGGGDLTLTSLQISGIAGNTKEDVAAVRKILIAHAPTLKELSLSQNSDDYPETDIFPLPCNQIFEKVQFLKLIGIKWRSSRFLQAFPNVKKLTLDVDEIPEDTQTPHVTLQHCTQLTLYNRIVEDDEFERVLNLLPNLKILAISRMDNKWFSKICQAWPNLTHLKLFRGEVDVVLDERGLTGYQEKDARKMNKLGRKGSWRPIKNRRANLTSLKKLQSFYWKLRNVEYSRLGYCFVACGVLELPELKYLCLDVENQGQMSLPFLDNLAVKFTWDKAREKMFE